jgi:hypothetical protein
MTIFNEIRKIAHLVMFVIFYTDMFFCQKFNLPHLLHLFWKNSDENLQISHMVSEHDSNYVKWYGSIYFQLS